MTSENKVYVNRTFECDAATLFDWLTKPEFIAQWFGPEGFIVGAVHSDLKIGGAYRIELQKGNEISFTVEGEYLQLEPNLIRFSYRYIGLDRPRSTISFRLENLGMNQTRLSMIQEFESEVPDFANRSKAWEFMFARLNGLIT